LLVLGLVTAAVSAAPALGDIDGDALRLVARQQICGGSTTRLVLSSAKLRLINKRAAQFAANVLPIIRDIQSAGHTSLNAIAGQLNARKVTAANRSFFERSN